MSRYLLKVELRNRPESIAKLMLLLNQGRLGLESASLERSSEGRLTAKLVVDGRDEKVEWLAKKLLSFPVFYSVEYESV